MPALGLYINFRSKVLCLFYCGSLENPKYCDGTKLEQAVDHKHSIYYKGEERELERRHDGLKPLTAQTTVVT